MPCELIPTDANRNCASPDSLAACPGPKLHRRPPSRAHRLRSPIPINVVRPTATVAPSFLPYQVGKRLCRRKGWSSHSFSASDTCSYCIEPLRRLYVDFESIHFAHTVRSSDGDRYQIRNLGDPICATKSLKARNYRCRHHHAKPYFPAWVLRIDHVRVEPVCPPWAENAPSQFRRYNCSLATRGFQPSLSIRSATV